MATFSWANTKQQKDSNIVIVGVPDESASHAKRRGCAKAPDAIRDASHHDIFERAKKNFLLPKIHQTDKNVYDAGNIEKKRVAEMVEQTVKENRIPIVMGGDHSITTSVLRGLDRLDTAISVVYFDAHPDFCGDAKSYDSIVCDVSSFKNIDFSSSIDIGVRDPIPAALEKVRNQKKLTTLTPLDVLEGGVQHTINEIKRTVGRNIYVSIDIDAVDPAFAPGVSSPLPGGLSSSQLLHLVGAVASLGIIGLDVMEVNPAFDTQGATAHLASRVMMETILNSTKKKE